MKKDKIMQEVGGFQDVANDFRDVWRDLDSILDYKNEREKEILDSFLGQIIHFEKEIEKSLAKLMKGDKK
tara:strand:+ start:152 stop:361 length:210 start_codon:yes stop_codon:yes gene_type:complete